MIIECPACATRYEVPDTAIGRDGRDVRCVKCRHSWHEDGSAPLPDQPEAEAEPADGDALAEPKPATQPASAANPAVSAAEDERVAGRSREPAVEDETSRSAAAASPRGSAARTSSMAWQQGTVLPSSRRSPVKLWTWAAVIFAIVAAAALLAVTYWGLPDWVPVNRPAFAAQPELQLDFPAAQQERRQLPNGTEFFGASGTITNTGSSVRRVPPILIRLRDSRERVVYEWEVVPPQRSLAPGESVTVNEAVTDVPRSAIVAEIGWKPA